MENSYQYYNDATVEMAAHATRAVLAKRNGNLKEALKIWEDYPKPGHPSQLIGMSKIFILQGDVDAAKICLLDVLELFSKNEDLIDDPLKSNCMGCVEHFGYLLRINKDKDDYIKRISGDNNVWINWSESLKRINEALKFLEQERIRCDSFSKLGELLEKYTKAEERLKEDIDIGCMQYGNVHRVLCHRFFDIAKGVPFPNAKSILFYGIYIYAAKIKGGSYKRMFIF